MVVRAGRLVGVIAMCHAPRVQRRRVWSRSRGSRPGTVVQHHRTIVCRGAGLGEDPNVVHRVEFWIGSSHGHARSLTLTRSRSRTSLVARRTSQPNACGCAREARRGANRRHPHINLIPLVFSFAFTQPRMWRIAIEPHRTSSIRKRISVCHNVDKKARKLHACKIM